ncbi:MAG: ImmA/IrrE family metallo-endopeptidase [Agriterribacter sp.]
MADIKYMQIAEASAKELIRQFKVKTPPVPVHDIARRLGLDVIGYDLGDDISGTLVIENGKGYIGFNPAHSKKRQRFTIGHELGHFKLHHSNNNLFVDKDFIVKYRSSNSYTPKELLQEQQANAFSAALLMPDDFIRAELENLSNLSEIELIETLAKLFDVSVPAMTYRLNNLNYL